MAQTLGLFLSTFPSLLASSYSFSSLMSLRWCCHPWRRPQDHPCLGTRSGQGYRLTKTAAWKSAENKHKFLQRSETDKFGWGHTCWVGDFLMVKSGIMNVFCVGSGTRNIRTFSWWWQWPSWGNDVLLSILVSYRPTLTNCFKTWEDKNLPKLTPNYSGPDQEDLAVSKTFF